MNTRSQRAPLVRVAADVSVVIIRSGAKAQSTVFFRIIMVIILPEITARNVSSDAGSEQKVTARITKPNKKKRNASNNHREDAMRKKREDQQFFRY